MDSLLPSPRAASPPLKVPFLNEFEYTYSPGGFTSLQGLHRTGTGSSGYGLNFETILSLPPEERASCLQAWLFFGLISEFFTRPIPHLQFVRSIPNEYIPIVVADPSYMSSLVVDWATRLSELSKEGRAARVTATVAILDFAAEQSEDFDNNRYGRRDIETQTDIYTLAAVMLSVKLLISYFRSTVDVYFQAVSKSSPQTWLGEFRRLGQNSSSSTMKQVLASIHKAVRGGDRAKMLVPIPPGGEEILSALLLLSRFINNGWCPVRARQLCRVYDYSIVNYLSRVRRSDPATTSHHSCEVEGVCAAYNLTPQMEQDYTPKHTTANCNCTHMIIIKDVLSRTIKEGYIPILSMDPKAENLSIKIHRDNGITPYTAISHVWSDGLGNPHRNSLPLCQLRRIAGILTAMKEEKKRKTSHAQQWYSGQIVNSRRAYMRRVYFWMDTLCIPVDGTKDMRAIKNAAIRHITPIFQGADQVLVLDSELESLQLNVPGNNQVMISPEQLMRDQEELTARIIASKWIQRAWTLEEGALARDCHFLVASNRTMQLGELVPSDLVSQRYKKEEKKEEERRKKAEKKMKKKGKGKSATDLEMGLVSEPAPAYEARLIEFDVPLKLLLAGSLNENRKQAARPGQGKRELRLFLKSRASQFVDAWNNLLERSATKKDDPILIFANILDFNAASIGKIGDILQRLPMVTKSCHELPVSLLFNTKKITRTNRSPMDAWIPSRIEGDRLVHSAVMTKWEANLSAGSGLIVDTSHCASNSFLILQSQSMALNSRTFCVQFEGDHGWETYVVEVFPEHQQTAWQGESGTCIIIDKATGSESVNGYTGRGAQFSVVEVRASAPQDKMFVRYACPIVAWTSKQWWHNRRSSVVPSEAMHFSQINPDKHLVLQYDASDWVNLRKQRPLLASSSPDAATKRGLASGAFGLIGSSVLLQIFVPKCNSSNSDSATDSSGSDDFSSGTCVGLRLGSEVGIVWFMGLMLFFVWKWYRGWLYRKWLRTFDDKWDRVGTDPSS